MDLQRLRKPVSSKPHPPQSDRQIPRARSHPQRPNGSGFGWRDETLLRWRMVVVLKERLWESSVERRETYGRESSFRFNCLTITAGLWDPREYSGIRCVCTWSVMQRVPYLFPSRWRRELRSGSEYAVDE